VSLKSSYPITFSFNQQTGEAHMKRRHTEIKNLLENNEMPPLKKQRLEQKKGKLINEGLNHPLSILASNNWDRFENLLRGNVFTAQQFIDRVEDILVIKEGNLEFPPADATVLSMLFKNNKKDLILLSIEKNLVEVDLTNFNSDTISDTLPSAVQISIPFNKIGRAFSNQLTQVIEPFNCRISYWFSGTYENVEIDLAIIKMKIDETKKILENNDDFYKLTDSIEKKFKDELFSEEDIQIFDSPAKDLYELMDRPLHETEVSIKILFREPYPNVDLEKLNVMRIWLESIMPYVESTEIIQNANGQATGVWINLTKDIIQNKQIKGIKKIIDYFKSALTDCLDNSSICSVYTGQERMNKKNIISKQINSFFKAAKNATNEDMPNEIGKIVHNYLKFM